MVPCKCNYRYNLGSSVLAQNLTSQGIEQRQASMVLSFHGDSVLMLFLLLFLNTCNIIIHKRIKWVKCLIRVFQISLLRWDIFRVENALSRTYICYSYGITFGVW